MPDKMNIPETITLKCLFCGGEKLKVDTEKQYQDDDLIECAACGKQNLYGGMKEMAINELKDVATKEVAKYLKSAFKGWGR